MVRDPRATPLALRVYRTGAALARGLPPWSIPTIEKLAGRIAASTMHRRRRQVERNLVRVYGEDLATRVRDDLVRETFASYTRYWIESFRLPGTSADVIEASVDITGFEHLEAGLAQGRGAIIALPHLGGWEWGALWLTECRELPVTTVVEPLQPPELAEWFFELRESFGVEIITLGPGAGSACAKALKANRVLCLVSDRDLSSDGVAVPFFGEVTTLPGGPATLALRSGAPLLSGATYFDGQHHRFVIGPPLDTARQGSLRSDVTRVTVELAERLEAIVRVAPEQWHLLQPNWPSDRLEDT